MGSKWGGVCLVLALAGSVAAQNSIGLGSSYYSFAFAGTGSAAINLQLETEQNGNWVFAYGGASGSGTLGSEGTYIVTSSATVPATVQSAGSGNYTVSQNATLILTYTSNGGWGYSQGTLLLQGNLTLTSVTTPPGTSGSATATGSVNVTGGALAGSFNGPAAVSLNLALGGSLDSLAGNNNTFSAAVDYPGSIDTNPPLRITTTSLYTSSIQSNYAAIMTAQDGTPPYSWSVSAGQLPPGLSLDASSGRITGVSSQAGTYPVTIRVADSASGSPQTASGSYSISIEGTALDAYGGALARPCPAGPAAFFYTAKIGNRWYLCTPAGNTYWMRGMYTVDVDDGLDYAGVRYKTQAIAKYGDADLTWGPQQNRRLKAWGFNTLAEYSNLWTQPTATDYGSIWPNGQQPVPMPFIGLIAASHYTQTNEGGYANGPVKDLMNGLNPNVYSAYSNVAPDFWDPNYVLWIANYLQKEPVAQEWLHGPNNSYLVGLQVDETDTTFGFGAGGDFPTLDNGQVVGGKEQPHLGWIVLVTAPTQTSNPKTGVTYTDTTVYAKQALANFLQQRYGMIQALNSAWGSNYTTFGSSGGWGSGTGLLDEDGTHPWIPKDYIHLSDANPSIKKDLDDFLLADAQKYFSEIKAVLSQYAPGRLYLGPTVLGSWGAPPRAQVLQGAGPNIDVVVMGTVPAGAPDDQQRVDFIAQNLGD
ncbi:MAG: putative Ig domain-containing protein, partial [Terriglobales bacterium]